MNRKGLTWGFVVGGIITLLILAIVLYLIYSVRRPVLETIGQVTGCGEDTEFIRIRQRDLDFGRWYIANVPEETIPGGKCSAYTSCNDLEILYNLPFSLYSRNHPDCKRKGLPHCCYASTDNPTPKQLRGIALNKEFYKLSTDEAGFYYINNKNKPQKIVKDSGNKDISLTDNTSNNQFILRFKPALRTAGRCVIALNSINEIYNVLTIIDCNYGDKIAFDIMKVTQNMLPPENGEKYSVAFLADIGEKIPKNAKYDPETHTLKKGLIFTVKK